MLKTLAKRNQPSHDYWLTLTLNRPNPGQSEKIKLNFYFRTSLRCLKEV